MRHNKKTEIRKNIGFLFLAFLIYHIFLISQNPLCFSHPAVQNLHPTFHYVLTLALSCAIVTLVLTIPGTGLPR